MQKINTTLYKKSTIILISIFFSLSPILSGFNQKIEYLKKGVKAFIYFPDFNMKFLALLAISLSLFLIAVLKKNKKKICFSKMFIGKPIIIFAIWGTLSFFWAHTKYETYTLFLLWTIALSAYFIVVNVFRKDDYIRILLFSIFISGLVVAIFGILQNISSDINSILIQVNPPASTFSNRNLAAHYILLTIPLGFGFFLDTKSKIKSFSFAISTALMVAYLSYTIARAAYLSFFIQTIFTISFFVWIKFKLKSKEKFFKNKKTIIVFAVTLFIVFAFSSSKQSSGNTLIDFKDKKINTIKKQTKKEKTIMSKFKYAFLNTARTAMFVNTLQMIKDNPIIGVGLGNWFIHYPLYENYMTIEENLPEKVEMTKAHNEYIEIFAELGIIGFSMLLWIMATVFILLKKLLLKRDEKNFFLILSIAIAFVGISVEACFSFPFRQPVPIFIMLIYFAVLDFSYLKKEGSAFSLNINKNFLIALSSLFLIITIISCINLEKSEHHKFKAKGGWENNFSDVMLREGEMAYELNTFDKKNLFFVGSGYLKKNDFKTAKKYLEESAKYYPNRSFLIRELGFSYSFTKEYKKAAETLARYLIVRPEENFVRNHLAKIYLITKNFNLALKEFQLLIKYAPQNSTYHKEFGIVLYEYFNDKKNGRYHLEKAFELKNEQEKKMAIKKLLRKYIKKI